MEDMAAQNVIQELPKWHVNDDLANALLLIPMFARRHLSTSVCSVRQGSKPGHLAIILLKMAQLASATNDTQVLLHGTVSLCVCLDLFFSFLRTLFFPRLCPPVWGSDSVPSHLRFTFGGGRFLTPQMGTIFIGF